MIILFYLAYFIAGIIVPNGLLHYFHGIMGEKIPYGYFPVFRKKRPNKKNFFHKSYGFNAVWGLLWVIIAFAILKLVGNFELGVTWDTGVFILGLFIGSFITGYQWNNFEKFSR